ncbi:MAG TPA: ImmA/IrrE family metallo-endopeptidase [Dehalococcoidia bacterium]|nr:ImmA/IrrE family metallo-endopeptidase [Dehalococcoidia bacterium]
MKWIADQTGRFRLRPYYDRHELDFECERIVSRFLERKYGVCCFPISTDDLTVMIEEDTSDLDLFADLSSFGENVEGLTDFFPDRKPAVKISSELSLNDRREHRLRTTLAHEYGHVKFHTFLWELNRWENPETSIICTGKYGRLYGKFNRTVPEINPRCKSSRIIDAPFEDWMEWQASYACGAFLMPFMPLTRLAEDFLKSHYDRYWLPVDTDEAIELTGIVAESFDVSTTAARVRLQKLGILQEISFESTHVMCKAV